MATIGEIVRLAIFYDQQGSSQPETVHTYSITDANPSDADLLTALSSWVENTWHDDWSDVASSDAQITGMEADILNGDGTVARNIGADTYTGLVGDVIGDNAAAAVAGLLVAYTAAPKTRGRKFIPGMAQPRLVNGVWNATTLAQLVILAAEYIADVAVGATGATLVAGVRATVSEAFVAFNNAVTVTDVPAYQRRRKPNVGS